MSTNDISHSAIKHSDILVIGSGVAGLRCALAASRFGKVLLACKDSLKDSNTWYAQGGIAIPGSIADDVANHVEDTIRVGCGLCDRHVVEFVIQRASNTLDELLSWGVDFDRDHRALSRGREGGHSQRRILHAGGDATGKALSQALTQRVIATDSIEVCEHVFVTNLLVHDGRCIGAIGQSESNEPIQLRARRTVIATGGAGRLFAHTTNPSGATGDGMAIAIRAGAILKDMEFFQFHPTAFNNQADQLPLITEAVRGEGGRLVDGHGRAFMAEYHAMGDLAPRDIVSRAIVHELSRSGDTSVYLDIRHFPDGLLVRRFPGIHKLCQDLKVQPERELIPVRPAAHYAIGGIKVALDGRSTLDGLYACGESASSGMHGANRLASNSLLEALVLSELAGEVAGREAVAGSASPFPKRIQTPAALQSAGAVDIDSLSLRVRQLMWQHCGLIRDSSGLNHADREVTAICNGIGNRLPPDRPGTELANILVVARMTIAAAIHRQESRGVHFRRDNPNTDDVHWRRRIEFAMTADGVPECVRLIQSADGVETPTA